MAGQTAKSGNKPNEGKRPEHKQRLRVPGCLPAPPSGEQPYAKRREELKRVSAAETTLWVMETPEWAEWMRPILETVDQERRQAREGRRGGRPAYTAEDIEKALLFQKVCGFTTYLATHTLLCADRRTREALGFTRANAKRATRYMDGVPSRATVSRHLRRFGDERRGAAWDNLARRLRDFHVANFPEMQEEMRVSNTDGSRFRTHYTTPLINPKTGEILNADDVTCPTGGYMPPSAGEKKWGRGWKLQPVATHTSVPWAWPLMPPKIHDSEITEATKLVADDMKAVLDLIPDRKLGVITADGGFHSQDLRKALREVGFIENIHPVSHKKDSEARAAAFRKAAVPITGYANWVADGHRQLHCVCGNGHTFARLSQDRKGRAVARVEGACKTCGSITITSGRWRLAINPKRWVRIDPSNPDEKPDYLFGNPFTFDDAYANQLGNRRFGHCEGMFGTLWKRWRMGEERWYRSIHQAHAELGMIFTIIHVAAMEQRRRKVSLDLDLPPDGSP